MSEDQDNRRGSGAQLAVAGVRLGVSLLSTKVKLIIFAIVAGAAIIALVAVIGIIALASLSGSNQVNMSMTNTGGVCAEERGTGAQRLAAASGGTVAGEIKSPVSGYPDSAMPIAATIVTTAREEGFSDQAAILAITTAMGESTLGTNPDTLTPNSDGDAGPFQQRQEPGWYGSLEQVTDPAYATRAFLNGVTAEHPGDYGSVGGGSGHGHIPGLKDIEGWEGMAPAEAIHAVQRNDPDTNFVYSDNYEGAKLIFQAVSGVDPSTIPGVGSVQGTPGMNCKPSGADQLITASGDMGAVLQYAREPEGLPYVFGGGDGSGPGSSTIRAEDAGEVGFDCSGLTSYAYMQGAGVELPRVASEQWAHLSANQVSEADMQPGDLIFYAYGRKGGTVDHVAIYLGNGQMIEASNSAQAVRVTPVRATSNDSATVGIARVIDGEAQSGGDAK